MKHRNLLPVRWPSSLALFPAALVLALIAGSAFAQDAVPPPPPDSSTAQGSAAAPSNVRAVRLSDVEGQVQVFQDGQVAFNQAEPNMPAVEGMRFVTGEDGRLEIEFEDGSVVRVAPNSSIQLTQLSRNPDGSTVTTITALTGLTYYELNGRDGQVSVRFGQDTATPDANAVFRIDLDAVPNELAIMQGNIHIGDGGGVSLDLRPNQTFQTDPQQPGEFTVAQSVTANSWDEWNSDRDQALADLESSETTARSSTNNPNDASWNDLDYYGSWYNVPGYGQVWSPNGVDASWDPFGDGYWGYYPAFGYSWISGYPWGWWPYHCGAWDYLDAWGWVWIPSNCGYGFYGGGWYPYPTVWRVPPGYLVPPRPRRGPEPHPRRLIAVNRGPQFAAPFHFDSGSRPQPRPLQFGGSAIQPLDAGIHPLQRGPLGETYTTALVRVHPEMAPAVSHATGVRSPYGTPIRTFGPPTGSRPSSEGYRPPPRPSPAPAPRPAAPEVHPAPAPAPHPSGGTPHR